MDQQILWRAQSKLGLEYLQLTSASTGVRAEGRIIGLEKNHPFFVAYTLESDTNWICRSLQLSTADSHVLSLQSDGIGNWTMMDGSSLTQLKGCLDLDISVTPFPYTLAIRRLNLAVGSSAEVIVAYLHVPTLNLAAVHRSYTRISVPRYGIHDLNGDFRTEVLVNSQGLIEEIPNRFRRIRTQ